MSVYLPQVGTSVISDSKYLRTEMHVIDYFTIQIEGFVLQELLSGVLDPCLKA